MSLSTAQTGQPFDTDPAISLKTYLFDSWSLSNPTSDQITFDTKFANMARLNNIIIKPLITSMTPQTLGPSRYHYTARFNIHIVCQGHSAKNNKFLIEQEVQRIIAPNPTGLNSAGIDIITIDDFREIENPQTGPTMTQNYTVARSIASVTMLYDMVVV